MNIKMGKLKSLAVAAVVAMASANASAVVVAAVTATGHYTLPADTPSTIPGTTTPAFSHAGGRVVATFSSECFAGDAPPASNLNIVDVDIVVLDTSRTQVAAFSPTQDHSAFCSAGSGPSTSSVTGVTTLVAGTYRVLVRARYSE